MKGMKQKVKAVAVYRFIKAWEDMERHLEPGTKVFLYP
jgi:hypothetical protein